MPKEPSITNLNASLTKYDTVKVIPIVLNNEISAYLNREKPIDPPTLYHFLGMNSLDDQLPSFWKEIYNYPDQLGLFALVASITTHANTIELFADKSSLGNMSGLLDIDKDKQLTNLRGMLVESGAADKVFRRKSQVPYDLSLLFTSGEVGKLTKQLFINRLERIGHSKEEADDNFLDLSERYKFNKLLSLSMAQYEQWVNGTGISNSLYELEKNGITFEKYGRIKALKVKQWLDSWEHVPNFNTKNRKKPGKYFFQFNIPALLLKRIYSVHSRNSSVARNDEQFSQRKHSEDRSNEIREYVTGGFPWSTITSQQKDTETYRNLQMPGWLPTSIIANILGAESVRRQNVIEADSTIQIIDIDENFAELVLPKRIWSENWTPIVSPIEIIDGQHRIKAFDHVLDLQGDFEFPVVAFYDLDFTWQAYLFYTINIKPKRINTSLAYDLMPLLRIQDWLEQDLNGPDVYKKVRAQELTELLWKSPVSPWFNRINMLGNTGDNSGGPVSQNAFINSLTTSFVKKWDGKLGGLFGGEMNAGEQDIIQWDKETQAAYLITIWKSINSAVGKSNAEWVTDLKKRPTESQLANPSDLSFAFTHPLSFFTTDQGIRPILFLFNDLSFVAYDFLKLNKFYVSIDTEKFTTDEAIEKIVNSFRSEKVIHDFLNALSEEIVEKFDWRTPSAFDSQIPEEDRKRQNQNQFRGSGGYREMRMQLLRILSQSTKQIHSNEDVRQLSEIAMNVQSKLGL
ncbi:DGQHR domain-containing protein [Mucilaginibacter sp. OK283]|uniref:DGQHR domain-containing protein n=1 Tax=Mucilaginibacter sp. OK283 TaxID=1881049 RepID=UPI0008BF0791|nr:DGQHR domain-containing protein [Mucilaginibacter sp. OK283]SEO14843.1 DGQHR domain-containing protein [Mucilaginibacter sp. OK283]